MTPRGIRNCNPLNIRRSKDQWKGLAERQQDAAFCQFKSLEYGLRGWELCRADVQSGKL